MIVDNQHRPRSRYQPLPYYFWHIS